MIIIVIDYNENLIAETSLLFEVKMKLSEYSIVYPHNKSLPQYPSDRT
jgi:hypothetical protein